MTELLTRPVTPPEPAPAATPAVASSEPARLAWARLLVGVTARTVLLLITSMALWGAIPSVIGWQPTTVVTGSMEPKISIGDIAVAMPPGENGLAIGRVLLFDDPDHEGLLRLHRLVSIDDQGLLVTRGDANDADDSSRVSPEDVRGVAVLRIPWIGTPIVWIHEQRYLHVLGAVGALSALMALSGLDRDLRRPRGTDADGAHLDSTDPETGPRRDAGRDVDVRAAVGLGGPALIGHLRRAGLVLLLPSLVVGLVAASTAPAWAAWTASTTNPTSPLASARFYSCSSAPLAETPRASVFWKLDETSGSTVNDSSGQNRSASLVGSARAVGAGCDSEGAFSLNGSTGYISGANRFGAPQVFTLEAWFRTSRGGSLISFGTSRTGASAQVDRHLYVTAAGRVYFGVNPGSRRVVSSQTGFADNRWHHAVATLSGQGMRLYVDGALVASNSSVTAAATSSGYFRAGYDNLTGWPERPTSDYFLGEVDNVAIYGSALDADRVAGHYESRS